MTQTIPRLVHDPEGLNTGAWPVSPDRFLTPVERFFTRSHGPIPAVDPDSWRLQVDGLVDRPQSFSLKELLRCFPRRQATVTMVCAGLRRNEFLSMGPLPGEVPWGPEPISTGIWAGIGLGDLLRAIGVAATARYVEFTGLDRIARQGECFGFGGSIDLTKALEDDVLLATELHGAPLPPVHGFPLRAVVPGWIGARSVKWLTRICLTAAPTSNYFQSRAYRIQRQINPQDPRDVSRGIAMGEVPLNAAILQPLPHQTVPAGRLEVRGWAMGAGGRPITRVELSTNRGRDWTPARITVPGQAGTWSFWESALHLARGDHTLTVRASDESGATQPSSIAETWNVKGYGNNAWHRVPVRAE